MPSEKAISTDATVRKYLYDVFLSHHNSDKPQVEMIAARLEDEAGLKPFLDKWHLVPGEPWEEELEEALDRSATCVVFLGPSGLGAWHNEEMRVALDERTRNKSFRVVPVLLPGAEPEAKVTLPRFLRRLTWIDFRAGITDQEAFYRLVAGIKGLPPGRQPSLLSLPSQSLPFSSISVAGKPSKNGIKEEKTSTEFWKIIMGAILALLLSTSFITAAMPRYKLLIKSPAFKKDGTYQVSEGAVTIEWTITKEQWFRESDMNDAKADLTIRKSGNDKEENFQNLSREIKTNLKPGKYEVRIDAVEYHRSETIALEVSAISSASDTPLKPSNDILVKPRNSNVTTRAKPPNPIGLTVRGQVIDALSEKPIEGAWVCFKWDRQKGILTSSRGEFILNSDRTTEQESKLVVQKQGYKEKQPWYHIGDKLTIRLTRD